MEAEELRIGNWINHPENYAIEVNSTTIDLMSILKNNRFKPIPLTEEILLKAGFVNIMDYTYELNLLDSRNTGIHVDFDDDDLKKVYRVCIGQENPNIEKRNRSREWVFFERNIGEIHQLQNLYYALTGEELEIDLND